MFRAFTKTELARVRSHKIGFVFQQFNLLSRTSALENVELPTIYAGVPVAEREKRAQEALERVGLRSAPMPFSVAAFRRAAAARGHRARAGEQSRDSARRRATGNLDSRTSVEIMDIFQKLNDEHGLTVVIVTHEPDIAQYAKRALEFRDGKMRTDVLIQNRSIAAEVLPTLPALDEDVTGGSRRGVSLPPYRAERHRIAQRPLAVNPKEPSNQIANDLQRSQDLKGNIFVGNFRSRAVFFGTGRGIELVGIASGPRPPLRRLPRPPQRLLRVTSACASRWRRFRWCAFSGRRACLPIAAFGCGLRCRPASLSSDIAA